MSESDTVVTGESLVGVRLFRSGNKGCIEYELRIYSNFTTQVKKFFGILENTLSMCEKPTGMNMIMIF